MWGARSVTNSSLPTGNGRSAQSEKRYIQLGFFSYFNELAPEESLLHDVGCIDTITGWWMHAGRKPSLSFGHVELRFSDNKAISITRGQGLHYEQRALSKCNYSTFFKIAVSAYEESKMQRYAQEIYEQKPSFNLWGMLWNFAPLTSYCTIHRSNAYFCTELIVKIIQEGGLFLGVDPSKISPNSLYDMCIKEPRAVISLNKLVK